MKLCVFDFDSTLMDGETIDFLADACGVGKEVATITHAAMSGEIDFFEALTQRVALLKGLSFEKAQAICHNLPFMPGAKETIAELKNRGFMVVVFSGGFRLATMDAKEKLGFDAEFSNTLHHKDGVLTGLVGGEMMFGTSKGELLERLQKLVGATKESTMAVGDGANDLSMFKHSGVRVAFCAKEALKKEATVVIVNKDLREILPFAREMK
jgi:phosphoserine phosphatase